MTEKIERPKVLFIGDKWCAGLPERGLSEFVNGIYLSLKDIELAETDIFHFDEYYRKHGKRGDEALLQKVREWKPDMILLIANLMPGTDPNILDFSTLAEINKRNIPIAAMFGDPQLAEQEEIIRASLPYVSMVIAMASETVAKRIRKKIRSDKYQFTWLPKSPKTFFDAGKTRDIGVLYLGSSRGIRWPRINALLRAKIPLMSGGGEAQEHLPMEEYASRYQRAKIILSFSRGCDAHVINARPFEAVPCGGMLLEQESYEMPKLLTPYVDYIPWTDNADLVRKAKYYLEHDEERQKIAKNGWKKMTALYSSERFWKIVIDKLIYKKEVRFPEFALTWRDLSHMPRTRAVRLKFLEAFCSTQTGSDIYLFIVRHFNHLYLYQKMERFPLLLKTYKFIRKK